MNVLDKKISCFKNYMTPSDPREVNLMDWLRSKKYAKEVECIRATTDKKKRDKLKAKLPCVTISGTFSRREKKGLIEHSGLICVDIDGKENIEIPNWKDLKKEFKNIVHVAYCGLSVSGDGYFLIMPIAYPEQHENHARFLEIVFWDMFKIRIDASCKNVDRLRGYSIDNDAYFNPNAVTLKQYLKPSPKPRRAFGTRKQSSPTNTTAKVESIISVIAKERIDLTGTYDDWLRIGFAFQNEFGEDGRGYFHRVSEHHPDYDYRKADRHYDHCRKANGTVGIGTFFQYAKNKGIKV